MNEFPKRKELFQFQFNDDKEPQVYFVRKAPLLCTRVTPFKIEYHTIYIYVTLRALTVIIDTLTIILSLLSLELELIILATYGSMEI